MKQNKPVTIMNTVAKSRSTSGNASDGGFEQKSGFSVKQGSRFKSGSESESMTKEQIDKMRQDRIKLLLPNKPEEKIPSILKISNLLTNQYR